MSAARFRLRADVILTADMPVLRAVTMEVVDSMADVAAHTRLAALPYFIESGALVEPPVMAPFDDRFGSTLEKPIVRSGRMIDQQRADELFANPAGAAQLGMEVGDTIDLVRGA